MSEADMTANDKYGKLIEVGDIVVYTTNTKSGGGGLTIGVIDRTSNGSFTIRSRQTRPEYAWEIGAPNVTITSTRPKTIDGRYVYEHGEPDQWGHRSRNFVYEEYEWTSKDYTKTGEQKHYWQSAVIYTPSNIIILRKVDWSPRPLFTELMNIDYSAEDPNG